MKINIKRLIVFTVLILFLSEVSVFASSVQRRRFGMTLGASFFNYTDSKEVTGAIGFDFPIGEYFFLGINGEIGGKVSGYPKHSFPLVFTGTARVGSAFCITPNVRASLFAEAGLINNAFGVGAGTSLELIGNYFGVNLSYAVGYTPNDYYSGQQRFFDHVNVSLAFPVDYGWEKLKEVLMYILIVPLAVLGA